MRTREDLSRSFSVFFLKLMLGEMLSDSMSARLGDHMKSFDLFSIPDEIVL